jgi:hypothetical protein
MWGLLKVEERGLQANGAIGPSMTAKGQESDEARSEQTRSVAGPSAGLTAGDRRMREGGGGTLRSWLEYRPLSRR